MAQEIERHPVIVAISCQIFCSQFWKSPTGMFHKKKTKKNSQHSDTIRRPQFIGQIQTIIDVNTRKLIRETAKDF